MSATYTAGIDVGGTKVAYALFDIEGNLLLRRQEGTPQHLGAEAFLEHIAAQTRALCAEYGAQIDSLRGVGIGMPCFIRQPEGHIIKSSNISALRDVPAKALLERALPGVRIALGNDTHAAGLAESRRGAGVGCDNILYCSVSSGIASAPILGGKLFLGSYGFSGESGHMIATPGEGILCACGKQGCFMSWCSGHMIVRHIRKWIEEGESTAMLALAAGDPLRISTIELRQAWGMGDMLAIRAIEQMQRFFALWFFNLYVFTNINCFVLGGGLLHMGEPFWEGVYAQFRALDDGGCPVYFKHAVLADDTGVVGANELLY